MDLRIAALLERLAHEDPAVAGAAREELDRVGPEGRHALVAAALSTRERVRVPALVLLAERAAEDPSLLRNLLPAVRADHRVYEDAGLAAEADAAMSGLREPIERLLPELLRGLADPDPGTHIAAAWDIEAATCFLGAPDEQPAGPLVDALLRALEDDCAPVRRCAALALANLALDPDRVVPALAARLADPSPYARMGAMEALGTLGPAAAGTAAAVAGLARDPDPRLAAAALRLLPKLGVSAATAGAALTRLRDPMPELRGLACGILGTLPAAPREGVEALRELAAKDPEEGVREAAAHALQSLSMRGAI